MEPHFLIRASKVGFGSSEVGAVVGSAGFVAAACC